MARKCKGCRKDISTKHPNAKFCTQRCKDKYWNRVNPRGLGVYQEDGIDEYDGSWDAHNY